MYRFGHVLSLLLRPVIMMMIVSCTTISSASAWVTPAAFQRSSIHCQQRQNAMPPLLRLHSETPQQRSNQQAKRDMIQYLYAPPPDASPAANPPLPLLDDDTMHCVETIVTAADGRKAENIVALYVAHLTTLCSVLVVVSGNSRPQNQAIGAAIRTAVPAAVQIEGTAESGWMILDYGSVMVHIMTPKSRLFYNVEGPWKQGRPRLDDPTRTATAIPMDIAHLLIPNRPSPAAAGDASSSVTAAAAIDMERRTDEKEEDPFWS